LFGKFFFRFFLFSIFVTVGSSTHFIGLECIFLRLECTIFFLSFLSLFTFQVQPLHKTGAQATSSKTVVLMPLHVLCICNFGTFSFLFLLLIFYLFCLVFQGQVFLNSSLGKCYEPCLPIRYPISPGYDLSVLSTN
jgi:hypothetical protein